MERGRSIFPKCRGKLSPEGLGQLIGCSIPQGRDSHPRASERELAQHSMIPMTFVLINMGHEYHHKPQQQQDFGPDATMDPVAAHATQITLVAAWAPGTSMIPGG